MSSDELPDALASQPAEASDMTAWPTGRLLSTAARLVEHAWVDTLDRLGLTHAGLIVLHLLQSGPHSQTDLAKTVRVQNQTISRTLERLQREGFIERRPDESDRRRHVVTITPSGDAVWRSARTLERDLMPDIADSDRFRSLLLGIINDSAAKRWDSSAGPDPAGGPSRH